MIFAASMVGVARAEPACAPACIERVKAREFAKLHGGCYSPRCVTRVRMKREAREVRRLTPFRGPDGRRWAIPWPLVRCESGGSWTAHNPTSPARGPYQLNQHGEPWPANTRRARLAHHRIAARLFRASGTGPWVSSRGCWG